MFGGKFVSAVFEGAVAVLIFSAVGTIAAIVVLFHVSVIAVRL
jgi:hypothetical protein